MTEVFKDIVGYEGIYKISNLGKVKSLKRKGCLTDRLLNPCLNNRGYLTLILSKDNEKKRHTVHQLVCASFLNHTPCGYELVINHIDFNKINNHVSNLEIVTNRENTNQKHLKSSSKYTGVSWNKKDKVWISGIRIGGVKKYLGGFKKEYDAHVAYQNELKNI